MINIVSKCTMKHVVKDVINVIMHYNYCCALPSGDNSIFLIISSSSKLLRHFSANSRTSNFWLQSGSELKLWRMEQDNRFNTTIAFS